MTESLARVQQKRNIQTGAPGKHFTALTVVAATALLAMLGGAVLYAQGQDKDKYSLKSPGGIAFSDFRGYEDWSVVSSARTEEVLKVIVANPAMIKAYKDAKNSADEKSGEALIDAALKEATAVPLGVAEKSYEIREILKMLEPITNPNMKSDLTTADALASAAIRGALANVEINLASLKDQAFVATIRKKVSALS